jgi:hypothetical protein
MEHSYFDKFIQFIKQSLTQKFKVFFTGSLMGLFGAKSLLFSGLSSEMVTFGTYVAKYIGTVIMAFSSGLATAYAAYLIDRHKEKKVASKKGEKKKNDKAA